MTTARGPLTKAGLAREATTYTPTYPGAQAAAAAHLLPLLSEALQETPVRRPQSRLSPGTTTQTGTLRALLAPLPLTLQATYSGLETLWALALGMQARRLSGTSQPQALGDGAYLHTFEIDPELHSHPWRVGTGWKSGDGLVSGQQMCRRATVAVDRQVSTWELKSAMVERLELQASPAGVALQTQLVGHSVDRSSAVNPNLTALSDPGDASVLFSQLSARIASWSASEALDAGDELALSGLTLGLDNRLLARQRLGSGLYIGEPRRHAPPTVSGRLVLPRYSADTVLEWAQAGTTLMAQFRFTADTLIGGATPYRLDLWVPSLVIKEAQASTPGPSRAPVTATWEATLASAPAAGFPSALAQGPLIVQVQSDVSTNPLES